MNAPSSQTAHWHVPASHPAFEGHFPQRPILPGVALLAEVLERLLDDAPAARLLGPAPRLGAVKFLRPCQPDARLTMGWQCSQTRVSFTVVREADAALVATGHFETCAP